MEHVHRLMCQAVQEKVFPGGVLLVAVGGIIRFFRAYGLANICSATKMTTDTVFDLASLSKALATTLAVMKLADCGKMDIEQAVDRFLPESAGTDKAEIRIRHLLTHTAGYPDHRPYYLQLEAMNPGIRPEVRKEALRQMLLTEPLVCAPGEKTIYSDLGFMLLEWIVEKTARVPLDIFLAENVYGPLGLSSLFFQRRDFLRKGDFAATEFCPWRKRLIEGEVHDENAWASGGVAGHAGLFGKAEDVFRLLDHLLECLRKRNAVPLFSPEIVTYFFQASGNTGRSLGFDRPSPENPSCGRFFSDNTVGHLGFTGTSFWMEPERSVIVILLSNRVHPSRENVRIRKFRPLIHDAVMDALFGNNGKGDARKIT